MNLSLLADGVDVAFNLPVPGWLLWGFSIAAIITLGLLLIAMVFAALFNSFTMGWLSADNPAKDLGKLVFAYLTYGLIPGMGGSFVGSNFGHGWGWFTGIALFIAGWVCLWVIEERKQRAFNRSFYSTNT